MPILDKINKIWTIAGQLKPIVLPIVAYLGYRVDALLKVHIKNLNEQSVLRKFDYQVTHAVQSGLESGQNVNIIIDSIIKSLSDDIKDQLVAASGGSDITSVIDMRVRSEIASKKGSKNG